MFAGQNAAARGCAFIENGLALLGPDAKTIHEHVHEGEDVRLPSRLIVDEAHADDRSHQIPGVDTGAYLACGDSPLKQEAGCFLEPRGRACVEFRETGYGKRQRRGHTLLGCDELDNRAHPAAQSLHRRSLVFQPLRELPQLLHFMLIDGLVQSFTGGKVAVERSDSDSGAPRHGFEARIRAARAENRLRGRKQALAIADRIGA